MKLKDIKAIYAEDITECTFEEIQKLKEKEKGFYTVAVSTGMYGMNGALLQGRESRKLYKVISRSSALFQVV